MTIYSKKCSDTAQKGSLFRLNLNKLNGANKNGVMFAHSKKELQTDASLPKKRYGSYQNKDKMILQNLIQK
jgi:hypothetical protein